jgi:hypothetical protein
LQEIVGESSTEFGMVGDRANDLITIKDAYLGRGIIIDAVYRASFAVKYIQSFPFIHINKPPMLLKIQLIRYSFIANIRDNL